ncbi:MAG: hypothetical protein OXE46_03175 [Chloroflexi bacterium]|nr:hypothetical protein [Chloroflexota bacterium]
MRIIVIVIMVVMPDVALSKNMIPLAVRYTTVSVSPFVRSVKDKMQLKPCPA